LILPYNLNDVYFMFGEMLYFWWPCQLYMYCLPPTARSPALSLPTQTTRYGVLSNHPMAKKHFHLDNWIMIRHGDKPSGHGGGEMSHSQRDPHIGPSGPTGAHDPMAAHPPPCHTRFLMN
jgi:hypothetical protein